MDQSKKTMRHFYCRDVLWETFEQMANDFDCSIDYLINEAMRYYARSKNYQSSAAQISVPSGSHGPMTPQHVPQAPYGAIVGKPQTSNPQIRRPPPPPAGNTPMTPAPSTPSPESQTPTLYLIYGGNRYPVVKEQFIIGRGSKTSDLAIKDGNISRKHAAVIRRNGTYYIKDLGSTNGIDYKGMRIDNKRVDEGDIFHICDYELRFTYRPE
ncbi:FHA domain-containing protein [Haliangium ochraceum]|uniref:FHA domain containing protein n=1 Tax=Haliangium ochraceum (strain DSM 14365 / JCM 11303 / SMP-2) TaxID=502025 RepID=D0LI33_HALO1|nr:FHA domain-containing protein [Haliangium ochraceum]ACY14862.1 FHA domain containing protein [Haliangium ochraceum DSM 14365]